jgi:imidazolonepropionase-like amidohydrolase
MNIRSLALPALALAYLPSTALAQTAQPYPAPYLAKSDHAVVLHAARLLDVAAGKIVTPGEILVVGDHISAVGTTVPHSAGAEVIDLGNTTLMPGLIDAHVHLFLHPGAEDMQTVEESVPQRVVYAELGARDDLMAGFTAERDMGTEGAGSASTAVRNSINQGLIPGPRMRVSANAISILGGHEDANRFNPDAHVPGNADYANNSDEILRVMRQQHKEGADFFKLYETGSDSMQGNEFHSPYQYTEAELKAAVDEAARLGTNVGVHDQAEPGTFYAAEAGVASIDHAAQLSDKTMALMKEKHIPSVPTFQVMEFFAGIAPTPAAAAREHAMLDYKVREFKRQLAAGVPFAVGSDVGPFAHGLQGHEFELMVKYGMTPVQVLQSDYLNGAQILRWQGQIGELKPGYYADIIAVPGNPLDDISAVEHVSFVMKGGYVFKR